MAVVEHVWRRDGKEWLRVTEPNSAFILNRVTRTALQEHSPVTQGATSYPTTLVL